MKSYSCAIVGGGAAGLSAAVMLGRALRQPDSVLLLEKLPRVGKKLLATGNGTCNISNADAALAHYHGDPALAGAVLSHFSPADTVRFFESLGVVCVRRENGRYYPRAEQAAAVLDCLRMELAACGVEERCNAAVTAIQKQKKGFLITVGDDTVTAETVLVCTGGAAAPALGGSTAGYTLLTALGHTRTPLFPSIVQLRTDTTFLRAMKGLRTDATVTVQTARETRTATGEVLFTEYGLSGPAVMQVSRTAADWERQKRGDCTVSLDLFPDMQAAALLSLLQKRQTLAGRTMENLLTGLVNKRIGQTAVRAAGFALDMPIAAADVHGLAALLKNWTFAVTGTQGFGGAQVTAGGIDTAAFDPLTLQSRLIPGLFAAGEVLNVDGDCGGYNLQFAFSSAAAATAGILGLLKGAAQ